jgi:hypothetical protein
MKKILLFLCLIPFSLFSQNCWEAASYGDEIGFIKRTFNAVEQLSKVEYGKRSMSESKCPDTGLPVYTWALEGEEIISPYTGRRYKQGPTGYFGPKERNAKGEIIAFGGDPLKYDLNPATATLLKNPKDVKALAFVSIPGNMIQQYHFGATNWVRFYGLLHNQMNENWKNRFHEIVGSYAERRRPSDGSREHTPLSRPYNLIGFPEETVGVLGGGLTDGGTENHKIMWRTSSLIYADLFPKDAKISGYSVSEAKYIVSNMFNTFVKKVLQTGNGEYDSQIYYPHSLYALLNLYDFSITKEHKEIAKFLLDYDLVTYGLKTVDNTIAGAQKRGFLSDKQQPSEMEIFTWAFTGCGSKDMTGTQIHLHQATTTYRPNRVISNILNNKVRMPYQAFMSRPSYHMNIKNAFQESFFRSQSYGLGNVVMTMVDNPNQQVVWSLVAKGENGPLCFGGQQPFRLAPAGHSQYSQSVQCKRTLVLISGNTAEKPSRSLTHEEESRYENAQATLTFMSLPKERNIESLKDYFTKAKLAASSWLYIPKGVNRVVEKNGTIFIEANNTFIVVYPLSDYEWIKSEDWNASDKDIYAIHKYLNDFNILSVNGAYSGYIIDSAEKSDYISIEKFMEKVFSDNRLFIKNFAHDGIVTYKTLENEILTVAYQATGLRAKYSVNHRPVNYDEWADGAAFDSPCLKIKGGKMYVNDGSEGYQITLNNGIPIYSKWNF